MDHQVALRAASVMALLDEWDESAQLALVRNFAACGQWRRAEEVADGFREKLRGELDDQPSAAFEAALKEIFVQKDLIHAARSSQGG
jgi:DNA-binding SARP family transcriptional activator